MRVFLSHSTKDRDFVEKLEGTLRGESVDPWLCEVDIEYGHNFVAKIEEGLREADLTSTELDMPEADAVKGDLRPQDKSSMPE